MLYIHMNIAVITFLLSGCMWLLYG